MSTRQYTIVVAVLLALAGGLSWRFMADRPVPSSIADAPGPQIPAEPSTTEPATASAPVTSAADRIASEARPGENGVAAVMVRGTVVRADTGEPIESFDLARLDELPASPSHWRGMLGAGQLAWQSFVTEQGEFTLNRASRPRAAALAVRAEGFRPAYAALPEDEREEFCIRLFPVTTVAGRVLAASGEPVPEAIIRLGRSKADDVAARTGRQGEFSLTDVEAGAELVLAAEHPDYLSNWVSVVPAAGETMDAVIVLEAGGVVEGAVMRGEQPVSGAAVMVYDAGAFRKRTKTDALGRYAFRGVPTGEVEVQAQEEFAAAGAPRAMQRRALVEAGATTVVDFQLPSGRNGVSGFVTVGGERAPGGSVHVLAIGSGGDAFRQADILDGAYSIENLPSGEAWLEFTVTGADGSERTRRVKADIGEGEYTQLDVAFAATGMIEGKVSNLAAPSTCSILLLYGDVQSLLADPGRAEELEAGTAATCPLDPDGRFSIANVEPGEYTVAAAVFDAAEPLVQSSVVIVKEGETSVLELAF